MSAAAKANGLHVVPEKCLVREYRPEDLEALHLMHARQGIDYAFPDPSNPLICSKTVLEVDGEVAMAILGRVTSEAYFLFDPKIGTPAERWKRFVILERAACGDGAHRGFEDVHAFIPPQIARAFGRRLVALGWQHEPFIPFCKRLA